MGNWPHSGVSTGVPHLISCHLVSSHLFSFPHPHPSSLISIPIPIPSSFYFIFLPFFSSSRITNVDLPPGFMAKLREQTCKTVKSFSEMSMPSTYKVKAVFQQSWIVDNKFQVPKRPLLKYFVTDVQGNYFKIQCTKRDPLPCKKPYWVTIKVSAEQNGSSSAELIYNFISAEELPLTDEDAPRLLNRERLESIFPASAFTSLSTPIGEVKAWKAAHKDKPLMMYGIIGNSPAIVRLVSFHLI